MSGMRAAALLLLPGLLGACVEGGPPRLGEVLPDFEAERLDGSGPLSLRDLRGQPFVLNVWATWCAPCRHETPYFQSLYERYRGQGLEMVGITVDSRRNLDLARDFLAEHAVDYIQLHDSEMISMDLFYIVGLPATYLIDAEGVVRLVRPGPVLESDTRFVQAIENLLSGVP